MELTAQQQEEFYALVERRTAEIDYAALANGVRPLVTRKRRQEAADYLLRAFNLEVEQRNTERLPIEADRLEALCKERVPDLLRQDKCGFIEVLLVMIIVNVISRVIVTWLWDLFNKQPRK